jgi:mannose-6-phosphate isomerase class I
VFFWPDELLGRRVHARFGTEFPIRFDMLDTMEGQNLSLQVHPQTEYIQEQFGMHYTQDESYYILDCEERAAVYLGLREHINPDEMIKNLRQGTDFPAERYVNRFPVKIHDHVLIPAGTVHCSAAGTLVLEISATPYIFTFKLWDWGRLGLDGLPRPVHIDHGAKNIRFERTRAWVKEQCLQRTRPIGQGDGWREEATGLHENEFIETRRHWFTKSVTHSTAGNLHVLNLVQGRKAVIESPGGVFEPFEVHYAETFIIPAQAGEYRICPRGEADEEMATIKAYVRF